MVNGEYANPLFKYLESQQGFKGFDMEHSLTPLLESMMEREHPNYKNEADIKWNFKRSCTWENFLMDKTFYTIVSYSAEKRPLAPQGRTSPLHDTGRPISSASKVPL